MTLLFRLLRQSVVGLVLLAGLTVLLGVAYPLVVWGISRVGPDSAEGSPRVVGGCVVGSELVGVDSKTADGAPDRYFHARVVGSGDDAFAPGSPAAGAPSNKGPNSEALAAWIAKRKHDIAERESVPESDVPPDAVTGSGSGLDPDISPAYAAIQAARVAKANGKPVEEIRKLVAEHAKGRQFGFLGEPRVNVGELNAALGLRPSNCG
ncbi:potassium-transporting ATPase subunit C [Segniliparus rugosus]|uniref:Potassium-transporting ATPase KdpC subunit n=1 Tax=Segniliparus rugosus (strain ATCC BAA-974 / DSM 45345 / CCUG 50838 / CIP 108380 / JCM 13579 / CDC 945) TaxID=679197 RepID=E5XM72_SEGRC|nr:potassium-transporting ATPase subunit C [Segniliparus rugosus]EFV14562.1 K+-transporting ATPase, C subunit [Segniliparus rugosus ATCC BAA-974]